MRKREARNGRISRRLCEENGKPKKKIVAQNTRRATMANQVKVLGMFRRKMR
ncbi:hypothetical protein AB4Z22_05600 [Paenibacillus sp. TAF58]